MQFIPDQPNQHQEVPYFEDVRAADGWEGQATSRSFTELESLVAQAIGRLGGQAGHFVRGHFLVGDQRREGYLINYSIVPQEGVVQGGRLNVAALPVRTPTPLKQKQALRMALYMVWIALKGSRFLQQLSPGYAALMPWMLDKTGRTMTELWSNQFGIQGLLLPEGSGDWSSE